MKWTLPFVAMLNAALLGVALAQPTAPEEALASLQVALVYNLRVVETACPTGLALPAARCYEHGYNSVFDFKEAFFDLELDLEPTELWNATTLVAGGDAGAAYRASFRTSDEQGFTLTFVEGSLLVLEEGSAAP